MGWERKRGFLNEFNEYLINENKKNTFILNTIKDFKIKNPKVKLDIKYIIILDSDTSLSLNSGIELIGAMAHPLNKPVIDEEKQVVVDGYGILQPRIGIELEEIFKTYFTEIFAGQRRHRFIYKCYFRCLSR